MSNDVEKLGVILKPTNNKFEKRAVLNPEHFHTNPSFPFIIFLNLFIISVSCPSSL